MKIRYTLNGQSATAEVAPMEPAFPRLGARREHLGRCVDQRCLQCSVLLNGKTVPACSVASFRLDGADVVDIDGLATDNLGQTIVRAFAKVGIDRCVDTYAGMVFLAYQLLSEYAQPSDDQLQAYSRHILSRCAHRDEWERATRLAGRIYGRQRNERGTRR